MDTASEAVNVNTPESVTESPRSRRMGMASPPTQFRLSNVISSPSSSQSFSTTPGTSSPPVPPRSPLRPSPRSITISSVTSETEGSARSSRTQSSLVLTPLTWEDDDFAAIAESLAPLSSQMRDRHSFPSLNGLTDIVNNISDDVLLSKTLPVRPESPLSLGLDDSSASSTSSVAQQPAMTKRHHALHELLSSERAYASDLALIRELHIPLALGQSVPLHSLPLSSQNSSASSSRTVSTSSDLSTGALGPPMSPEDVKIIFSNIAELAIFSDLFCEELEEALGSVLEGGQGEDRVGELFLKITPELERPYKYYITRHPTALSHLQSLPQTPALTSYLTHTQNVASSLSHAWDLSSLLIKPVQRLLKYPLLLSAIIDESPDGHPDKENLKLARSKMEEVARNVNEGRRRAEVIKDVLSSKKKPLNVGVSASVNLSKMKSLRHGGKASHMIGEGNSEAAAVEKMEDELKRIEVFAKQFAKNVVDWSKMMSNVVLSLRVWAISFGKVIGLSADQGSEAFDAFLAVVEQQLMVLCIDLEAVINERLLKEIAHLLTTMNQPLKLLASMNEQEPYHYHLLTMNVSKHRPPASLLSASTNYLALRGQLAAELPHYLSHMHRGLSIVVRTLALIQTEFWRDVKDRWGELWEMLRVEGELNAGHEETVNVWQARWGDVDEVMASLNINQMRKLYQEPIHHRQAQSVQSMLSSLEPVHGHPRVGQRTPNTLVSEPPHVVGSYVSPPFPLTPSRTRARGTSDASLNASRRSLGRRTSNDSLYSGKSSKPKSPRRRTEDYIEHVPAMPLMSAIPRTKSMPLPSDKMGNGGYTGDMENVVGRSSDTYDDRDRGRPLRSSSYKRKSSEAPKRPAETRQRSGSIKSITSYFNSGSNPNHENMNHEPFSAEQSHQHISSAQRDSWVNKRAKYVCQAIHPCKPPAAVSYFSFPFFTLREGDLYEVLQEAGHPSLHPKLPLYVDDGEDCLLLCRDEKGNVGWALASFLEPLGLSS